MGRFLFARGPNNSGIRERWRSCSYLPVFVEFASMPQSISKSSDAERLGDHRINGYGDILTRAENIAVGSHHHDDLSRILPFYRSGQGVPKRPLHFEVGEDDIKSVLRQFLQGIRTITREFDCMPIKG